MNYIWEIMFRANEQNINENELFFEQSKRFSPYYEQSFIQINEKNIDDKVIEINSFYRFEEMFMDMIKDSKDEHFKSYLFDSIIHFLIQIDLKEGISKKELYIRRIIDEVLNGIYNENIRQVFKSLTRNKQIRLAHIIYSQMQIGSSLNSFKKASIICFERAIIYQEKAKKIQIVIYLNVEQSKENEQIINSLIELFLPITYKIKIFYNEHFGVIGVKETMLIDNTIIY